MAGEIAGYLDSIWHAEGGNGNAPDLARLAKESRNNVRDALMRLEVELMALWGDAMTNASRVAIYARVSTVNHGRDASLQTRELRQFAEARGWQIAGEYVDAGVSGAKDSCPELNRLMADAKRRRFDVVLVWKLDRFGRSLRHLVNALAEFESLNIAFVSLSDNLDLSTPSGRLMFNIIGAMAEFERELIGERVKAGMKNAKAKGTRIGRPRVVVDGTRIAALRQSGLSWPAIAREMGRQRWDRLWGGA
jgi:DNA invertase Pin-like site-specific DNA recombinase